MQRFQFLCNQFRGQFIPSIKQFPVLAALYGSTLGNNCGYLKTTATADSACVEFAGQVQRIARVHHYGLRDRISRKGPEVRYAKRRLLGMNNMVVNEIHNLLMHSLSSRTR